MLIFDKKILRKKSLPWKGTDEELEKLVDDMGETMEEHIGIGISAIQIGVPVRVFLAEYKLFVNPQIVSRSPYEKKHWESCLSCPGVTVRTKRHHKVTLRYDTVEEGKWVNKEETFKDWSAVVVQHEFDHLNGFLIEDRGKAYYANN